MITGLLGNKQHTLQNGTITIRSHSEAYCKYLVQQLQVSITIQLQCDPGAAVAAHGCDAGYRYGTVMQGAMSLIRVSGWGVLLPQPHHCLPVHMWVFLVVSIHIISAPVSKVTSAGLVLLLGGLLSLT